MLLTGEIFDGTFLELVNFSWIIFRFQLSFQFCIFFYFVSLFLLQTVLHLSFISDFHPLSLLALLPSFSDVTTSISRARLNFLRSWKLDAPVRCLHKKRFSWKYFSFYESARLKTLHGYLLLYYTLVRKLRF